MTDGDTNARLQRLLRREGRTLLQYASASCPWGTAADRAAVAELVEMARAESEHLAAFARLLIEQRVAPPYLGAYPMAFASLNYLTLDRLLPLLVGRQRADLLALEEDVSHTQDGIWQTPLRQLAELKRLHLRRLETLQAARSAVG